MLRRNTLFACPACSRHVLPKESACPECRSPLRGADGTLKQTPMALMMGLGAVFGFVTEGCGGGSSEGGGGGGGEGGSGGATSTAKVTSGPVSSVSAYGAGPTMQTSVTTGMPGVCDDGAPTSIDSPSCTECFTCALEQDCSDELAGALAHPDFEPLLECLSPCRDVACEEACSEMYPDAGALYLAVVTCAVCDVCPNNCDAANNCM